MKFVISTQELNNLVTKCQNVVAQNSTIPILSNLLIEATEGELILTATDLTVGVRCYKEAKILEEGATTVPAKTFASLTRELTAVNLEVTTNDNEITEIVADSSRFKIHGMNRAEFPSLPELKGATQFTIKQKDLRSMLFRTAFAVSREDNRYTLTGVSLNIDNGKATFVGTDGKRLARTQLDIVLDSSISGRYIIPIKAVEEILKNLTGNDEANVALMPDKIAVEANNTILITKLLSGDYPDIESVIPEKAEVVVTLHREELMTLLRQVSLFTGESMHSVRFSFTDGELKLSVNTTEVGEGKVSMPIDYQGQKIDIAFNPNYFLDILRHSEGETLRIGVTDAFNPGLITYQDKITIPSTDTSPLFVLMPMRLDNAG